MITLNPSSSMTDYQVVHSILKKKNVLLQAEIYARYASQIYFTCLGLLKDKSMAKDLSQDILIKILQKLDSFKGTADFSFWVHAITKNHCLTYLEKMKKMRMVAMETMENIESSMDDLEIAEMKEAKLIQLEIELYKLTEGEQFTLTQKYFKNCSIKNLAYHLDISESAVKMRLNRGRDKLRKMILKAS